MFEMLCNHSLSRDHPNSCFLCSSVSCILIYLCDYVETDNTATCYTPVQTVLLFISPSVGNQFLIYKSDQMLTTKIPLFGLPHLKLTPANPPYAWSVKGRALTDSWHPSDQMEIGVISLSILLVSKWPLVGEKVKVSQMIYLYKEPPVGSTQGWM